MRHLEIGYQLDYRLLGAMEVWEGGALLSLGGVKQRAVLAMLLLNANVIVEFDRLIAAVWNDAPPAKATASLRAYVANLRRIIDFERPDTDRRLVTHSYGYRLNLGDDRLDVRMFEERAAEGRRALATGNPADADRVLAKALDMWRGHPLADFRDHAFADNAIQRLEAIRADAVEARFEAGLLLGRDAELVPQLEMEIRATPLQERLWGQLMLSLYRAGRRADALRAYQRVHDVLALELGVRPGEFLRNLSDDIRRQSGELDWRPIRAELRAAPTMTDIPIGVFGRAAEFDQLQLMLAGGVEQRGQVAVLSGDSGVGKSALAAAAIDDASGLGMWTAWSGHPDGVRKPRLWAWTQVLRRLGEDADPERIARARTAAPGVVAALVPEWLRNGRSGTGDAPVEVASEFELIEGTAQLLRELTRGQPTLIVLDDLHRADRATREVLELVSGWVNRAPLVVLVTWPDGGTDVPIRRKAFDRLLSRCDTRLIKLRGIDDSAVGELIQSLTGVVPTAEFVARIRHRTGGNPFYVRELIRLLHSRSQLDVDTREIDTADVPDAVAGVIRRRMADLPRQTRSTLGIAAVIGTDFGSVILAHTLEIDVPVANSRLEPAIRAGLIHPVADRPGRFTFSHGLVRDAIAGQFDGARLATMHADVARVCLRGTSTLDYEQAIAAADHAWRAGDALAAEPALALFDQALSISISRSAYAEVADLDTKALEVCGRLPSDSARFEREAGLYLQLASVTAILKGQNAPAVVEALERAFDAGSAQSSGSQFSAAVALRSIMVCGAGRFQEGSALAEGLVAQYAATGDPIAGSGGYYIRAMVRFMSGDLDGCLEAVEYLLEHVPHVGAHRLGPLVSFDVRAYGLAAWAHAMRGDLDRARALAYNGIDVASSRGDVFGGAVTRTALVQLNAMTGVIDGTVELADEVHAELAALGMDQIAASPRIIGNWAKALVPGGVDTSDDIRRALDEHAAGGTRILTPLYLALLCDVEAAHGSIGISRTTLHRAELLATATGERVWDNQLSARRQRLRADKHRSDTAS